MTTDAPQPAPPDKDARLREFAQRIDAGEFAGDDKFHRFVAAEVYPLLRDGTFTAKDLERLTLRFSQVTLAGPSGSDNRAAR
jgi:hypothetical protein